MSRYNIYTALIGIVSVFFMMSISLSKIPFPLKTFFLGVGAIMFVHSAWTLYRALIARSSAEKIDATETNAITQISLLNKDGEIVRSWELYGKTAAIIGKDIRENHVDIDLGWTAYAAMVDVEHAALNFAGGNWYVEDLDSENGISVKKFSDDEIYKLSVSQPCKLDLGDIIFIGLCQLKLH